MYVEHIKVCIYTTMQTDVVGRIQVGRYHYVPVDIEQYMIPGIICWHTYVHRGTRIIMLKLSLSGLEIPQKKVILMSILFSSERRLNGGKHTNKIILAFSQNILMNSNNTNTW